MSLYVETVPRFTQMLTNIDSWLTEASEYAASRGFDPESFLSMRLYPDQFPLRRQIQSSCDTAKLGVSRLTGVDAPVHEDGEQSIEELRARITEVKAYMAAVPQSAFEGRGQEVISPGFLRGGAITTENLVRQFSVPNFYFHATTAYSILRHNGVKLGKMAFIGGLDVIKPS